MQQFEEAWKQLNDSLGSSGGTSPIALVVYLVLGGLLALYIRWLYRRFSASPSDTDSITRIFPLLVIVTTAVIAVVKFSLALSLGLVGALSIVRFRTAIKEPEELAYLFLCIAIGLALGAELPVLAIALVIVATLFILFMHWDGKSRRESNLLLTITGDSTRYFSGEKIAVISAVEDIVGSYTLQRLDIEDGRGQLRVSLGRKADADTMAMLSSLRERLPDCELSYVNLDAAV